MTEDRIVNVPLADICFDKAQPRVDIDQDQLGLLQESMRRLGRTVQYITVAERDDGSYLLVSGERRVRAALAFGRWPRTRPGPRFGRRSFATPLGGPGGQPLRLT